MTINNMCYESIVALSDQCEQALSDVAALTLPQNYKKASSIVFCGMGGSAYGGRIIKSLFSDTLKVPVEVVTDYHLPGFVNESTLVFVASYSGSTEETVSCMTEAVSKKLMVMGISSGGEIKRVLEKEGKPVYCFEPKYNPSGQPRIGQGYMQIGQITMLSKLGYLPVTDNQLLEMVAKLRVLTKLFAREIPQSENSAKRIAQALGGSNIMLIGAQFLEGAIHAIRNPFHETGKHFADYAIVPELNHHLMEGLSYPVVNKKLLHFVFIESDLYSDRIKKRMELTREVVAKNGMETHSYRLTFPTKLGQVFELIVLGSFITYYLAMYHGVDPAKIPWVDYFKKKLKEN